MSNILKKIKKIQDSKSLKAQDGGFTLIELAIVIMITGILISFMGSAFVAYMKKNRINTTEFRMKAIREALDQYLNVNGNYPCAASRFKGPDEEEFGQPVNLNCMSGGNSAGTVRVNSSGGLAAGFKLRIGAVPVRILNLPDEFMTDGWDHKFTYAVTENLATQFEYQETCGAIPIKDGGNASITTPADTAHYVLVSHGETGNGAFPAGSGNTRVAPCSNTAKDGENCNDDDTFTSTLLTSDRDNGNFYDDYVYFQGQATPVEPPFPDGAIAMFNTMNCPAGWSPYTAANGRFVIGGKASGSKTVKLYQVTKSDPFTNAPPFSLKVGDTSENDHEANMPAYVALHYCQKDPSDLPACATYAAYPYSPPPSCPTCPPVCQATNSCINKLCTKKVCEDKYGKEAEKECNSGGKILCGHYFNRGLLAANIYAGDLAFAAAHVDAATKRGYHLWATPLTQYLNNHPGGLVEKIVQPFVVGWAEEMAYRTGYHDKGNWIGKIEITFISPLVKAIGLVSGETEWKHLKSEQEIQQGHKLDFLEKEIILSQGKTKNAIGFETHACQ